LQSVEDKAEATGVGKGQGTPGSGVVARLWLILEGNSRFSTLLKCGAEVTVQAPTDPEKSWCINM